LTSVHDSSGASANDGTKTSETPEPAKARPLPGRRRWPFFAAGGVAMLGIALGVMRMAKSDPERHTPTPPPRDVPSVVDGRITFSPSFAERAGLATQIVEIRAVTPTIATSGTVSFDPRRVTAVGTRIGARASVVEVVPGQRVEAGAVLARLEAAELANVQAEVEILRARVEMATAEAERKQLLATEGITARGASQMAETERRALAVELGAATERVRALGGSVARKGGHHLGRFELRSPIGGEVVEVSVQRGQPVEPNQTLFRVADLSEVWIELALFESALGSVLPGDEVLLSPRSRPEIEIKGTVAHVAAVLDPESRTARVRVVVPNVDRRLVIGESVIGRIRAHAESITAAAVPTTAVAMVDGAATVFVVTAPGVVEPRVVETAAHGLEWVAVTSGISAGEEVVTQGVFALKSELFR